jgi:hypothetical protein
MAARIHSTSTTVEAAVPVPLFPTQKLGGGQYVIANGHHYAVAGDGRLSSTWTSKQVNPIVLLMNWR